MDKYAVEGVSSSNLHIAIPPSFHPSFLLLFSVKSVWTVVGVVGRFLFPVYRENAGKKQTNK